MEQIINQVDNWTIVRWVGGLSVVLVTAFTWISYLLQHRLIDKWKHWDEKELQALRGVIEKNNSIFTTVLSKSLPDKVIEKRLAALETFWNFVVATKNKPPAAVSLIYSILADDEITLEKVKEISKGELERLNLNDVMMIKPMITDYENLRYLVPPKLWTIVFAYQIMINRTTYLTIRGLQTGDFEFWKNDTGMKSVLTTVLDEKEIKYIYGSNVQTFHILISLLEYKILGEMNKILSGENDTEDSLKVVERIGELTKKQESVKPLSK